MAGAGRTDGDGEDGYGGYDGTAAHGGDDAGSGMYSTASDAQLTELLRADTPTAYPALRELRLRHRPAVLSYARLCTVGESAARQLTAQAFALAARDTARGIDPRGPWRHQLLLLAGRVAASWAAPLDHRASRLDPGLLALLRETSGPDGPVPPMLDAFQSLPSRVQGLIWYGVVDEEPDARTTALLGAVPQDVTYGKQPAFQALRQACLKTRLARSGNPRCQDFRRLIEEAAHPENPRYSAGPERPHDALRALRHRVRGAGRPARHPAHGSGRGTAAVGRRGVRHGPRGRDRSHPESGLLLLAAFPALRPRLGRARRRGGAAAAVSADVGRIGARGERGEHTGRRRLR